MLTQAIAAMALTVVIGDSNAVPWIIHEQDGYVAALERQLGAHVEALPLPAAGFERDAARARHAIRTADRMGATTIVLALGTADVAHGVPPRRIAKRALRRYRQALAIAERVVVVGCFQRSRECALAQIELFAAGIPLEDLVVIPELPATDFIDAVHLNAAGHQHVADAILARLR